VTQEEDEPEAGKVYIKTAGGMKEEIIKFSGGEAEDAVKHVLLFRQTEQKMDILKDYTILTKSKSSKENRLETITENSDEANRTKKKLKDEIVGLKVAIKTKMDEYWTLWTQLLDDSLKDKWNIIVEEQMNNEKGYMVSGGACTTRNAGR
jgi:hypothetical protein